MAWQGNRKGAAGTGSPTSTSRSGPHGRRPAPSGDGKEAIADATVVMQPATLRLIRSGKLAKGEVLAVARVAGIMAAKRTPEIIPLCHPLRSTLPPSTSPRAAAAACASRRE